MSRLRVQGVLWSSGGLCRVRRLDRQRRRLLAGSAVLAVLLGLLAGPAAAVNVAHSVVVSADPVGTTPNVLDGQVNAIVQVGGKMIAGGSFTQVRRGGGPILTRNNIFAFDPATGNIDTAFVPGLNGSVNALEAASDGQSVFVGGTFTTANGTTVNRLTKLNVADGQRVTAFSANTTAQVRDLALRGGRLFVGGDFGTIKGQSRSRLAAVNETSGDVDANLNLPFAGAHNGGATNVYKFDVDPAGTRLIAIGNFTTVGGVARRQAALLDVTAGGPASVANWQTDRYSASCSSSFNTYMRNADFAPDGSWFVIVTTGAYRAGTLCDTAARWETGATGSGLQPTWVSYTGGDTLYSVGITGTAVYIGGHQRWHNNPFRGDAPGAGAVPREGIAALDPVNGLPFSWNPGRSRGVGAFALYSTTQGLWVGSDTDRLGGEFHARLGMFPTAGGTTPPQQRIGTLPGDLYRLGADGTLVRRSFNGTSFGAPVTVNTGVNWSQARGAYMISGRLFAGWSDNNVNVRTFDGTTVGPASNLNLLGLNGGAVGANFPVSTVTGMFFDPARGRLYYTLSGDNRLLYRGFEFESDIMGAEVFVAAATGFGSVRGMTMAGGNIYFANTAGTLSRVAFAGGAPQGAVTPISGPGIDGINWTSQGLFVFAS
jgi:hypothetical protein